MRQHFVKRNTQTGGWAPAWTSLALGRAALHPVSGQDPEAGSKPGHAGALAEGQAQGSQWGLLSEPPPPIHCRDPHTTAISRKVSCDVQIKGRAIFLDVCFENYRNLNESHKHAQGQLQSCPFGTLYFFKPIVLFSRIFNIYFLKSLDAQVTPEC